MPRTEVSSDRTAALAATIAAHAVALLALLATSPRMPARLASSDEGAGLEVSFVKGTLPRDNASDASHHRQAVTQSSPLKQPQSEPQVATNDDSTSTDSLDQAATPAQRDAEQIASADSSISNNSDSTQRMQVQSAQTQPDAQDQLAELRRRRAEAERQRQQDGLAEMRKQDVSARAALVDASGSGNASNFPIAMIDVRAQSKLIPVSYSATYAFASARAFDANNGWTFAYDSQPRLCPHPSDRSRNDAATNAHWIDCLLDTAARDVTARTMHGMVVLHIGFAPTVASHAEAGFVIRR